MAALVNGCPLGLTTTDKEGMSDTLNPTQTGLFAQSKDRGRGDSPRRFIEVLWSQFSSKFTKNGLKGHLA